MPRLSPPQLELANKQSELQRITADVALLRRRSAAELQRLRTTLAATGLVSLPPAPNGLGQQPEQMPQLWQDEPQGPSRGRLPTAQQQQQRQLEQQQQQLEQQLAARAWAPAPIEQPMEPAAAELEQQDKEPEQLSGDMPSQIEKAQSDAPAQQQQPPPPQQQQLDDEVASAAEQQQQLNGNSVSEQQASQQQEAAADTNGQGPTAGEQQQAAPAEEGEAQQRWRFGLEPEPVEHPAWVQETAAGEQEGGHV